MRIFVGIIAFVIAGTYGVGGFGTVPLGPSTMLCALFALAFLAGLIAVAVRPGSRL